MSNIKYLAIGAIVLLFSLESYANIIATRSALDIALGSDAINEDFESWSGNLINRFEPLDSTTTVSGQGPGIVNAGLEFTNGPTLANRDYLWLDRRTSFQLPSAGLLGAGGQLVIDFLNPNEYVGFDMYQFAGFASTALVHVYAADDTTLLYTTPNAVAAPDAPAVNFFGYEDTTNGIGRVVVDGNPTANVSWSPFVDNLTYGVSEPHASSLLFVACMLAMLDIRNSNETLPT